MKKLADNEIKDLIKEAISAMQKSYSKYSNFKVGAVIVDDNGNHFKGTNVENASYGLTSCAERNAIFTSISGGMKKISIICVVGETEDPISPCGGCRQIIAEFADEETIIILSNTNYDYKIFDIKGILPYYFKF